MLLMPARRCRCRKSTPVPAPDARCCRAISPTFTANPPRYQRVVPLRMALPVCRFIFFFFFFLEAVAAAGAE